MPSFSGGASSPSVATTLYVYPFRGAAPAVAGPIGTSNETRLTTEAADIRRIFCRPCSTVNCHAHDSMHVHHRSGRDFLQIVTRIGGRRPSVQLLPSRP